ncbi:MAG: alcohol dehydrogenase catalytic domain-containing protein [Chloroflexota bacterium]
MLSAYCTGKLTIAVQETDAPKPAPGDVLVRVRVCGICGSDLHFYDGSLPIMPNVAMGHEFAGDIVALGDGVEKLAVGDRVAVEPVRRCTRCEYCTSGRYSICRKRKIIGTEEAGGLAEYVSLPAYMMYKMPDAMDYDTAALAEPLAISIHGLHVVNVRAGERVLILGSGTIGLMATLAARAMGAEVIAVYRHDHQGEAALALGASRIVRDGETAGLERQNIDVVIETVGGHARTIEAALGIVRGGGRVSVLGIFNQPSTLNGLSLVLKEVAVTGAIGYCRPDMHSDFETALSILETNAARARTLITHRYPLPEAAQAFATAADKSTKSLKVQVQM